jgi:hypothetical protein
MTTRAALPLVIGIAALAAAPAAGASLPKPKTTEIKVGSSIAGVKVGMDAKKAVAVWGDGSNCVVDPNAPLPDMRCTWAGTAKQAKAYFEVRDGKVYQVAIEAGFAKGDNSYSGPVAKWKDKKGIGLGSYQYKTAKAYPKAFGNGSGLQLNSGKRATLWGSSGGRNYTIIIGSVESFSR